MDLSQIIDQAFNLLKLEPGSGLVQSVLLLLIWINIRSLKNMLEKLEVSHDTRIGVLESKVQKIEQKQ